MAENRTKIGGKMEDPGVQSRDPFEDALPQRVAYIKLFGSQFVLPVRRSKSASEPETVRAGVCVRNNGRPQGPPLHSSIISR